MNEKQVCVVVPIYKPRPSDHELISLTQLMRVLGHYPVFLVTPTSLDVDFYQKLYPTLQIQTFSDSFFTNIQSYNRLMLSEAFYAAFSEFEFMLIHQLDAFVFRDELQYWCQQGYDYIGAPWLRDRDFQSQTEEVWFRLKQRIATLLNLKKDDNITPREIISLNKVGNGGFSLRRIEAMRQALQKYQSRLAPYFQQELHQYNEDAFWGIEVNRYGSFLRIPDFRIALRFAVEFYPKRAVETYNQGQLPFGCHAWDIHGTDFWRPIFASIGYPL